MKYYKIIEIRARKIQIRARGIEFMIEVGIITPACEKIFIEMEGLFHVVAYLVRLMVVAVFHQKFAGMGNVMSHWCWNI